MNYLGCDGQGFSDRTLGNPLDAFDEEVEGAILAGSGAVGVINAVNCANCRDILRQARGCLDSPG